MQPPLPASALLPEAGVAALAAGVLFYAGRGLHGMPLLPRLVLGLIIGIVVTGGFGLVILALSPAGGLPWQVARHEAAAQPVPAPAPPPASPQLASPTPASPVPVAEAPHPAPTTPAQVAAVPAPAVEPPAAPPAAPLAAAPVREAGAAATVIFYGTDRARVAGSTAVAYSAARADRLEVGRATVAAGAANRIASASGTSSDAPAAAAGSVASSLSALSPDAFAGEVASKLSPAGRLAGRAVVFVHGYNPGLEAAVADAGRLAEAMGLDVPAFVYAWPSASAIPSYSYDATSAAQSARFLKEFLALVATRSGARDLSIIALDIGAEPVLAALAELSASVAVKQVVFFAPDIDAPAFGARVEVLARRAHVSLYAANSWRALTVSRRFNGGRRRAGEATADGPLVVSGIDTIEATPEAGSGPGRAVIEDWSVLIRTGAAASARASGLERVTLKPGLAYWRLKPPGR